MADDECIELSSDDEDEQPTQSNQTSMPARNSTSIVANHSRRSTPRRIPKDCLNLECEFGEEYLDSVPEFVSSYYKVKKRKGLKVCRKCFEEACSYYSDLKTKFAEKQSIFDVPMSKYKPILSIDSDEDELSSENEDTFLDAETVDMIKNELPSIMKCMISSENFTFQFNDTLSKLHTSSKKLLDEQAMYQEKFIGFQREIDKIRNSIYEPFRPIYQQLGEWDLPIERVHLEGSFDIDESSFVNRKTTNGPSNMTRSRFSIQPKNNSHELLNQDVVAVSEEVLLPPSDLPGPGLPIKKPKLKVNDIVYAKKFNGQPWKIARIIRMRNETGVEYLLRPEGFLRPLGGTKNEDGPFWCIGKHLAYEASTSLFRYPVRYRVLAKINDEAITGSLPRNSSHFFPGIVAEPPTVMNKFRYLIFFDGGFVQYVPHKDIRLVCETTNVPWDEVPIQNREFIKKYVTEYPERPMVRLQVGNVVQVKFNDLWLGAKVLEVDCSLAKVLFHSKNRVEWIYRGSPRLRILYSEFEAAKRRRQSGNRVRALPRLNTSAGQRSHNNNMFVEYTHNIDGDESEDDVVETPRAVARKSTNSFNKNRKWGKPERFIRDSAPGQITPKRIDESIKPKRFVAHQCNKRCIEFTGYDYSKARKLGPLAIPLNFGFRRIICHSNGGRKNVLYKSPCGRSLRRMEEVHSYLRLTKSTMTVDLFDFDYWVDCTSVFVINEANFIIPDVTEGKEQVAISCVNYLDNDRPTCSYMATRVPRESVVLNLQPEFLTGCDCEDDCQDREKCSCWQLTINAQSTIPNIMFDPNVGYHYRRLGDKVMTGIYECNQLCKCSKISCLNRVVQYPLSQQLQLYKTKMKGWGLRCLNDIPQGSFICVYAGHLLPDHLANEEGKNYGDEYLADLDYIEVVENLKYGYESDVEEDLDDNSNDEDDDEQPKKSTDSERENRLRLELLSSSSNENSSIQYRSGITDSDNIRSRLRERKSKHSSCDGGSELEPEKKKKKNKEEHVSIRQYYGAGEDEIFIMDAKSSGNIGRYLNHSCTPNVFVQSVFVDTHDLRFPWVAFFAQTFIRAGTELTWDYNYTIGSVEGKIKYCYCGSEQCRGRLL